MGIHMKKSLMIAAAIFTITGGATAIAQESSVRSGKNAPMHFSVENIGALTDARVAAIKAGLGLTPDQAKNWPAFEQAYRNLAKLRSDRMVAADNRPRGPDDQNSLDRLQHRADRISQYGAALEDLAKTARPLYQSLNDAQKRRFVMLARALRSRHQHYAMWRRTDSERGPIGSR
jgi:zinc resistance-associated protein